NRSELPRDRPPRLTPHHAQAPLQLGVVDLDHDTVDLKLERSSARLPFAAALDHLLLGTQEGDVGVHGEAVLTQPLKRLPLRREPDTLGCTDPIGPERQRSLRGELRIELTDRARR